MVIHEMTLKECHELLEEVGLARVACEMDHQPYVVPVYLAYDGTDLFGFATMGYKIDCMRANPLVCVEIDDIKTCREWRSIIVFGKYDELPDTPEYQPARAHAHSVLQRRATWWEPAYVAVEHRDYPKSLSPIFYRIRIDRMTGHRASPNREIDQSSPHPMHATWLSKVLERLKLK